MCQQLMTCIANWSRESQMQTLAASASAHKRRLNTAVAEQAVDDADRYGNLAGCDDSVQILEFGGFPISPSSTENCQSGIWRFCAVDF